MSTFCNTLQKGDRVIDAESKRPGEVARGVRQNSRSVEVLFQGTKGPKRVDIVNLRFIDPTTGTPEELPPYDGDLPAKVESTPSAKAARSGDVTGAIESEIESVKAEIRQVEDRFKELRERRDRLVEALGVLKPAVKVAPSGVLRIGAA